MSDPRLAAYEVEPLARNIRDATIFRAVDMFVKRPNLIFLISGIEVDLHGHLIQAKRNHYEHILRSAPRHAGFPGISPREEEVKQYCTT